MKERKQAPQEQATFQVRAAVPRAAPRARSSAVPDSITNLRDELVAALDPLKLQFNGLHYLSRFGTLPDLVTEENNQIAVFGRRIDSIQAVITALDALVADGYPDELTDTISPELDTELRDEVSAIEAAATIFKRNVAKNLQVNFTQPTPKE
jgi:hypothetical protein